MLSLCSCSTHFDISLSRGPWTSAVHNSARSRCSLIMRSQGLGNKSSRVITMTRELVALTRELEWQPHGPWTTCELGRFWVRSGHLEPCCADLCTCCDYFWVGVGSYTGTLETFGISSWPTERMMIVILISKTNIGVLLLPDSPKIHLMLMFFFPSICDRLLQLVSLTL